MNKEELNHLKICNPCDFNSLLNYFSTFVRSKSNFREISTMMLKVQIDIRKSHFKDPAKATKIINRACRSRHIYNMKKLRYGKDESKLSAF